MNNRDNDIDLIKTLKIHQDRAAGIIDGPVNSINTLQYPPASKVDNDIDNSTDNRLIKKKQGSDLARKVWEGLKKGPLGKIVNPTKPTAPPVKREVKPGTKPLGPVIKFNVHKSEPNKPVDFKRAIGEQIQKRIDNYEKDMVRAIYSDSVARGIIKACVIEQIKNLEDKIQKTFSGVCNDEIGKAHNKLLAAQHDLQFYKVPEDTDKHPELYISDRLKAGIAEIDIDNLIEYLTEQQNKISVNFDELIIWLRNQDANKD
jgi:hypothetical protein